MPSGLQEGSFRGGGSTLRGSRIELILCNDRLALFLYRDGALMAVGTGIRWTLAAAAWGAAIYGALSIADAPGDWGHGICGPWGCGPPLQALVACHTAWVVVLTPPVVWLARSPSAANVRGWTGAAMAVLGLTAIAMIAVREYFGWASQLDDWDAMLFLQRCAFCVAIAVDAPALQFVLAGAALWLSRSPTK